MYDIKTHKWWLFAVETLYGVHLHGLNMRDTYINSIINDNDGNFKAQNVAYQMTYAVKTV